MSEAAEWEGSIKAEEALARIAAALPQGVALVREGRIVWANRRLCELSGRRALDALLGTELSELLLDAGCGLPGPGLSRPVECTLRRENGQERSVLCRPLWLEISPQTDAWSIEDTSLMVMLRLISAGMDSRSLRFLSGRMTHWIPAR